MPPSNTRIVESVLAIYYLSGALAEVVVELLRGGGIWVACLGAKRTILLLELRGFG